ncbi:MAG: SRPBCC domain-containing protein [Patescibacteria group bacterium]
MTNTTTIEQSFIVKCEPEVAFTAWLDSKLHGEMLSSPGEATIDPKVGGKFSIWDGAITGETLRIDQKKKQVVQSWRYDYDDWSKDEPSKLTIEFLPHEEGRQTKVQIRHTDVPENHAKELTEGWEQYYWSPMKEYFVNQQN